MACGTPAIVSNVTSLPEVVGEAASIFDCNDPKALASIIMELLEDKERYMSFVSQGKQEASFFSWDSCVKKTLEIFLDSI